MEASGVEQICCNFVICDFGFADFTADAERDLVAGMKKPSDNGMTIRYAAPEVRF
jgi:hypothetical protein